MEKWIYNNTPNEFTFSLSEKDVSTLSNIELKYLLTFEEDLEEYYYQELLTEQDERGE